MVGKSSYINGITRSSSQKQNPIVKYGNKRKDKNQTKKFSKKLEDRKQNLSNNIINSGLSIPVINKENKESLQQKEYKKC
jgi:hypothetical protein